jgi:hypothetical protein
MLGKVALGFLISKQEIIMQVDHIQLDFISHLDFKHFWQLVMFKDYKDSSLKL